MIGHRNVLVLGAVVTLAWLVDGSSQRYLGTGLAAIAVGLGSTLVADGGVQVAEQALVYPRWCGASKPAWTTTADTGSR